MGAIRKGTAIVLAVLVLAITVVFLLALWDLIPDINFREIFGKFMWSVFTIFISSVLLLFIFSVLYKGESKKEISRDTGSSTKTALNH